ncbi:GNAT family N-acetyltransferase [Nitrospina watsonii]|uniref:N-acetyltransferase domain-containing protein n=1 Tax=Nitrospina watsonii TaxID=1323948 RepID=A0ABN8VZT3_9BACT|nr:GNAT family N-acetyltransferase [Nitrospina watsonii]CAI2719294.1 conserved protein of unknown function [Nitrospina watsonii]
MNSRVLNTDACHVIAKRVSAYPHMALQFGDVTTFKRFRFLEPGLVSLLDTSPTALQENHNVLVLIYKNDPIGCISLVAFPRVDSQQRISYNARLDLVIVPNGFRGMGIGRCLIHLGLGLLLETLEDSLQTLSASTQHPAVDRVLQCLEFTLIPCSQDGSLRRTLDLQGLDRPGLLHVVHDKTNESFKRLHDNLRRLEFKI